MKKLILTLASLFLVQATQAADFRDFVAFEKAKLTSYAEAEKKHKETGQPVIVWLNIESFDHWYKLKNDGIHCFPTPTEAKAFEGRDFVKSGVVIAKSFNGVFSRAGQLELVDKAQELKSLLASDFKQSCANGTCASGTCATNGTCSVTGNCASGQCGLKSFNPTLKRVCVNGTCYLVQE